MYRISIIPVFLLLLLAACKSSYKQDSPARFAQDSALVENLINEGDSIYALKNNYNSFSKSLSFYDSAWQIAVKTNDTLLIAHAVLAKGRAYDAINNNPQKTIDYYAEAARLYASQPREQNRALYLKFLVAHAYDKVQDSTNTIKILRELYNQIITKPDSIKRQLKFTVEMALASTVVKNYAFADSILRHLTRREWVQNDSTEYDYLNHYLLVKAKIDVLENHLHRSKYVDSVAQIFVNSRNLNDSMFFSSELWGLYKAMNDSVKESYYLELNNTVFHKFNSPESVRETRVKLEKLEVAAVEAQRNAEIEKAKTRRWSIYILTALLAAISLLALFLNKRNKEIKTKQKEVVVINNELQQKNLQNELLNKEIHHRIKNNLQMIMSLVYMQENKSDTDEVKENMQSIRLRIESIASLHQQLMEQSDVVDLRKYIQYLITNATNLMADNKKIITHLDIEPIQVPQKISFPLGLLINELVTNSVKYAQPENGVLEITVKIYNGNNTIKMHYKDNGIAQTIKNDKKSLGLEIVNLLTRQFDAVMETNPANLYDYKLTIPLGNG